MVNAVYRDTRIDRYQGNPLIEALPPILDRKQLRDGLSSNIEIRPTDIYLDGQTRIHVISQLLDSFPATFPSHRTGIQNIHHAQARVRWKKFGDW